MSLKCDRVYVGWHDKDFGPFYFEHNLPEMLLCWQICKYYLEISPRRFPIIWLFPCQIFFYARQTETYFSVSLEFACYVYKFIKIEMDAYL